MRIQLDPEFEKFLAEKVRSGAYPSAADVLREGLLLLRQRDELERMRRESLRRDIAVGVEQIERGEYSEYDEGSLHELFDWVKKEGRRRLAGRKSAAARNNATRRGKKKAG